MMLPASAISLASLLSIPNCSHKTFAPIFTACLAISGVSFEGRKTFTKSTESFISYNFDTAISPDISLPSDDIVADMYQIAQSHLTNNGFEHYEISNWANNHNYSKHNLAYWQRKPYIGLGPGAHSNIGNARFWAIKSPKKYVQESLFHETATSNHLQHVINEKFLSDHSLIDGFEILTEEQISSELMFLGLRLLNGINTQEYYKIFGIDLKSIYKSQLKNLVEAQLLENSGSQIKLSPSKIFVSNGIFEEFL